MKKIFYLFTILYMLSSCNKLNIAPNSIIQDNTIYNTADGIRAFMASLYTYLPIEDFRYNEPSGFGQFFYDQSLGMWTGELSERGVTSEGNASDNIGYWPDAYTLIRNATDFINKLPTYKAKYTTAQVNQWTGEARFLRAYTYYALVKRYGGVPLIITVTTPGQVSVPRNSEQEIWDYVNSELQAAADLMQPISEQRGRANKYIALGILSRTALYAGTLAKYNIINKVDAATGKRVLGIASTEAIRYLKQSYNAALAVAAGGYQLYRAAPDKATNFYNLFYDVSSANKEYMFSREYVPGYSDHQFDLMAIPYQMQVSGSASFECPTLDWVELFDGLPRNADGSLGNINTITGKYNYYNSPADFFQNAEPRLLGSIIVPMGSFKGVVVDIRRGIYTGDITNGISAFQGSLPPYPVITNPYTTASGVIGAVDRNGNPTVTLPNGAKMQAGGLSGIYSSWDQGTSTGFHQRKFLDQNLAPALVSNNNSTTPWPELRYAEVELNRAEAAYELYTLGQSDANYQQDAYTMINDIRDRAGAVLLTSAAALNDVNIIRNERRKELGFESKIFWDQRRWRTADKDINNRDWFVLNPIYVAANGKYILDKRKWERNALFTFTVNQYYNAIPGSEISKDPKLIDNSY
ncbi:MAG: Starch-binding associating with outer rane [Mucilaginibacter sp.]|nr:Starch-binding associating with outer rane [Mucilaginibacter sp.]